MGASCVPGKAVVSRGGALIDDWVDFRIYPSELQGGYMQNPHDVMQLTRVSTNPGAETHKKAGARWVAGFCTEGGFRP